MSEKCLAINTWFQDSMIPYLDTEKNSVKTDYCLNMLRQKDGVCLLNTPRFGVIPEIVKIDLCYLGEGLVIRPDGCIWSAGVD